MNTNEAVDGTYLELLTVAREYEAICATEMSAADIHLQHNRKSHRAAVAYRNAAMNAVNAVMARKTIEKISACG